MASFLYAVLISFSVEVLDTYIGYTFPLRNAAAAREMGGDAPARCLYVYVLPLASPYGGMEHVLYIPP